MFQRMRKPLCAYVFTMFALTAVGCASVPRLARADLRRQQYLATHRGIPVDIALAIEAGHVSPGMDRDQVLAVLGQPVRTSAFPRSHAEIWLYPASRLHQDQIHAHGAASFRLVFLDERLSMIEPI